MGDSGSQPRRRPAPAYGSLAWGERTGGRLARAERRHMLRVGLGDAARLARSRLLLALGRGDRRGTARMAVLEVPDTSPAVAVETEARARQSPAMLSHALRTVAFAHAVAGLDGVTVDAELLWCACLLHDVCLEHPVQDRCFAVRGGLLARDIALAAGSGDATATELGDAVSAHPTPGLDPAVHPLPYLVAAGALVDVLGARLEQMRPEFVAALLEELPRGGFASGLAACWRAEARAVPGGRAALAERPFCFSTAARFAPLG